MIKNIKTLLLVSLAMVACNKNDDMTTAVADTNSSDGKPLTAGTANFSKYVAVGNSLTAGFSDGALFKEGQKGSWTNVLNELNIFYDGKTQLLERVEIQRAKISDNMFAYVDRNNTFKVF